MKFNSQICTTREQSERLLALGLKKETADMMFIVLVKDFRGKDIPDAEKVYSLCTWYEETSMSVGAEKREYVPAWSLHRLIEMMPITVPDRSGIPHCFTIEEASDISYYFFGEEDWGVWKTWNEKELYDNVIDCIEWLIKEGHFNKEYLEGVI